MQSSGEHKPPGPITSTQPPNLPSLSSMSSWFARDTGWLRAQPSCTSHRFSHPLPSGPLGTYPGTYPPCSRPVSIAIQSSSIGASVAARYDLSKYFEQLVASAFQFGGGSRLIPFPFSRASRTGHRGKSCVSYSAAQERLTTSITRVPPRSSHNHPPDPIRFTASITWIGVEASKAGFGVSSHESVKQEQLLRAH